MEIESHPILQFKRMGSVKFSFEGRSVEAYQGEPVAMALYRNGIDVFSESPKLHRPRGIFCAIGKCSSCLMEVNGIPNVRTCILTAQEGMVVKRQKGFGELPKNIDRFRSAQTLYPTVLVVGSGPAGLEASITLKKNGVDVLLLDQNPNLGGQLIKQTHKFFGSKKEGAGTRGIKIAEELISELISLNVNYITNSTVFAYYPNENLALAFKDNQLLKIYPKFTIFAIGASEKMIPFEGNDLPNVMGAGAAQTLMNVYGIKVGENILVVGAGNVGLIVSYQLLQAGMKVKAVIEAAPKIGGYFVHAAKLRRFGVPIYTQTTIKKAMGNGRVEKVLLVKLNENFEETGEEFEMDVDAVLLAVGLQPSYQLLAQAGCELKYIPSLGGYVPLRNAELETTKRNIYVAGDVTGIEEASTAMIEGKIASFSILKKLGFDVEGSLKETQNDLERLRSSPFSLKIVQGLKEVMYE
ncbi:FAD-dependent oxidoreductase [Caldisericum exile]|uniref:Dye-linked L-proline dehydrogenase alpha subunit n=1 Tax=Caldisericum exile (strain DSM 21853 / NBRC 104410 / AZM16c01) TaxID=511051 RepID=A0A7U6GEZ4_CALEA|nr:FAD-dependent oxidoreductase [Caldisericum exile]BAL81151.1 dye-linked L-proline dehydrogenase alpha subunit [Caldisericum exile AZM16c01]